MAAPFLCKTEKYMANNEKNLIPNSERTPQQLKEMTSKAGKASGEARSEKKFFFRMPSLQFLGTCGSCVRLAFSFFHAQIHHQNGDVGGGDARNALCLTKVEGADPIKFFPRFQPKS